MYNLKLANIDGRNMQLYLSNSKRTIRDIVVFVFHYNSVYKSLPLKRLPSQLNPIHVPTSYSCEIIFQIILQSASNSPGFVFSLNIFRPKPKIYFSYVPHYLHVSAIQPFCIQLFLHKWRQHSYCKARSNATSQCPPQRHKLSDGLQINQLNY